MYQRSAWAPKLVLSWRQQHKTSDLKPPPTFLPPDQNQANMFLSFPYASQSSLHMSNFRQQAFLARHHSWLCVLYRACLVVAQLLEPLPLRTNEWTGRSRYGRLGRSRYGRLGEWADDVFPWRIHLSKSSQRWNSATENSFQICGNDLGVSEEKPINGKTLVKEVWQNGVLQTNT